MDATNMSAFKLESDFIPTGDQPEAIKYLVDGIKLGHSHQVLLGVTGSGKTFTMANVIEKIGKPTLIIAPNKTLAAQLYNEFKGLFPSNRVEYFVSYYDYYQPEAYIPSSDTYIQKDASINDMIDRMRHSATRAVLSRTDVIVVASVSCIYGLGAPADYLELCIKLKTDMELSRDKFVKKLVDIQYTRNDIDFHRGTFRVRGDRIEIFPVYEEEFALRVEFFGDTIESISEFDPLRGDMKNSLKETTVFPASHYVTMQQTRDRAIKNIKEELKEKLDFLYSENKLVEAQRLEERTEYDLEIMLEIGYCTGIENYSRHLTGRAPGEPPPTLFDYFSKDFLLFFDESHISVSQLGAMYKADKSRKKSLINHGFRLPSAADNRPLTFQEFQGKVNNVIYVSATPADYEIKKAKKRIARQIVRPTGLLDPPVEVRSAENQVDDLYEEIIQRVNARERVLVTTLTKRMAEDLTDYYFDLGVKVKYLHSGIGTIERVDIIQDLRKGVFDVLIGINLLREGLDIPEVSLVAVLDADKEGFLRSFRSFIQTFGRASRNEFGRVIMYADKMTDSMKNAIDETRRRRKIQKQHNEKYDITPTTIIKELQVFDYSMEKAIYSEEEIVAEEIEGYNSQHKDKDFYKIIKELESDMKKAAKELKFEKAAAIRDKIKKLKELQDM